MTQEDICLLDGHLRPVWRFLLSLVLVFFASIAAYVCTSEVRVLVPGEWPGLLPLFELLGLLAAFKIMTRVFERKPLAAVGLAFHPDWAKELCVGAAIGGTMMVSVGGTEALLGLARFSRSPVPATAELAHGGVLFLLLFLSATDEELIFRGYPFQKLVESLRPVGAVVLSSAMFGLAHLGNPHHTWISTLNTMLVGVPLSIAYLRTRSLWMPVGMHVAWNYIQGFALGLPVSGIMFSPSLLRVHVDGAAWLTGSAYGPEGGLLSAVAIVGAAICLFLSARIKMNERMKELVFGPSSGARDGAGRGEGGSEPGKGGAY